MNLTKEKLEYKHGDVVLEGYLAFDGDTKEKRPGILIVHEWLGRGDQVDKRADRLAELGYVGFALDMYGKGVLGTGPADGGKLAGPFFNDRDLMRDRARAGLKALKEHSATDPNKVAAIGYCFGGTTVLELARDGEDLAGVASFHGGLDFPAPMKASPPKAKILVCHGADDPFTPEEKILAFQKEMRKAKADWQMTYYGNAVHSFTNTGAGSNPSGGSAYDKKADQRSWEAMKNFFKEIF